MVIIQITVIILAAEVIARTILKRRAAMRDRLWLCSSRLRPAKPCGGRAAGVGRTLDWRSFRGMRARTIATVDFVDQSARSSRVAIDDLDLRAPAEPGDAKRRFER